MDCSGLKRGKKLFEEVILADGYSLEMHAVGTFDQADDAAQLDRQCQFLI